MVLPLIPGLTEIAEDAQPMLPRLIELLSKRPVSDDLSMALGHLETAFKHGDDRLRGRIALAISLIRGEDKTDNGA